ncbi:MAG: PDZ domain-containing protein [Acidobacteriota bacterium]|nr:PDZ domain-containing protein [Acidobacteriota bacterium]
MQMNYRSSIGCAALVCGFAILQGERTLSAAQILDGPRWMAAAAMTVGHGSSSHGRPGYLGVEIQDIADDEIAALKLQNVRGAEITSLDHDGPACKAGMRTHDVILQMNGQLIEGGDQLRRLLREIPAGRVVSFVISREGQTQTISTQMADRRKVEQQAWEQHYSVPAPEEGTKSPAVGNSFFESAPSSSGSVVTTPKGHRDFLGTSMILSSSFTGAKLEVMGPQLAVFFGAEAGAGLLVRSVADNSPAAEAGMKAGDVVVRINSIALSNGADWGKTVRENRGRPVPVVVLRDKREQTLTLTPDAKKRSCLIPGFDLEEFLLEKTQQTRELLAKL